MENQELLLLELEEFDRANQTDKQISQNLVTLIEHVAKTGTHIFPWNKIKKLYLTKLTQSIESFYQSVNLDKLSSPNHDHILCEEIKSRILDRMKSFYNAPFTIQRISELLLKPLCNYTRLDKFLRGIEKCVMVVTTVDPQGNKIFTESMMNGGILNDNSVLNGGVFYQKSFNSLQIETTIFETASSSPDKIKLTKQAKIDIESDIETKVPNIVDLNEISTKIETEEAKECESEKQVEQEDEKKEINLSSSNEHNIKTEVEINKIDDETTTTKREEKDEKMKMSGSENENIDEAMDN